MHKMSNTNSSAPIQTVEQAASNTNLGIGTVRKLAAECGAALKIGRSYRINFPKLIEYISTFEDCK